MVENAVRAMARTVYFITHIVVSAFSIGELSFRKWCDISMFRVRLNSHFIVAIIESRSYAVTSLDIVYKRACSDRAAG